MADEKEPIREVAILVHREVFNKYGAGERDWLETFIGSHMFQQFCKDNQNVVQADLIRLNPSGISAENFTKLSIEMRMVWRFWTDLLTLAEELQPNKE